MFTFEERPSLGFVVFKKVSFGDDDAVLGNFNRRSFSYNHQLKPCRLITDEEGNQKLIYNALGLSKEDIQVKVKTYNGENWLTIHSDKVDNYGNDLGINNEIPMIKEIDVKNIKAKTENGILIIDLPIKDKYKKKEIEVKIE